MADLLDRFAMAESGGNINARSPTPLSSAQGLYGFTDAAFQQVLQDNPDLAHVTKDAWAVDPQLQRTFAERLKQRHERVLRNQGLDVNPVSLYANWHFGEGGGPKFLKAAPDTPMEAILDPIAIKANPHLQNKTQAQVLELLGKKVGTALPNAVSQNQGTTTMNPQAPSALPNARNAFNPRDPMSVYDFIMQNQQNAPVQQMTPEQQQMLMGDRRQRASMLPLAIGASLAGDPRVSGMGKALYGDAVNAQGPLQLGNEGWLTADGQLIENPLTQSSKQENRRDRALNMAVQVAKAQQGGAPYYTPIPTAQGIVSYNNRTGQPEFAVGPDGKPIIPAATDPRLQGDIAGAKKGATVAAEKTVTEQFDAPKVIAQGEDTIKLVDDLLASPGFKQAVGKSRLLGIQMIPGTDAKDFDIRLEQLKGKQFLQAFESLKGGGQITEIEGKKATDAMSRMNAAGSESEFIKASREFQEVIRTGVERARRAASGGGQPQQPAAPQVSNSPAAGGLTPEEQRELDELRAQFGRR